jgi:hypothetical protein
MEAVDVSLRAGLRDRRAATATAWSAAIAGTGFSPLSGREVRAQLPRFGPKARGMDCGVMASK